MITINYLKDLEQNPVDRTGEVSIPNIPIDEQEISDLEQLYAPNNVLQARLRNPTTAKRQS